MWYTIIVTRLRHIHIIWTNTVEWTKHTLQFQVSMAPSIMVWPVITDCWTRSRLWNGSRRTLLSSVETQWRSLLLDIVQGRGMLDYTSCHPYLKVWLQESIERKLILQVKLFVIYQYIEMEWFQSSISMISMSEQILISYAVTYKILFT